MNNEQLLSKDQQKGLYDAFMLFMNAELYQNMKPALHEYATRCINRFNSYERIDQLAEFMSDMESYEMYSPQIQLDPISKKVCHFYPMFSNAGGLMATNRLDAEKILWNTLGAPGYLNCMEYRFEAGVEFPAKIGEEGFNSLLRKLLNINN